MVQAFTTIVSMSKTACFIIAVVLLARLLLKKAPKVISYVLWSVVFIRLLCPFSFSSPFYGVPEKVYEPVGIVQEMPAEPTALPETEIMHQTMDVPKAKETLLQRALPVCSGIWLVGVGGMLLYGLVSYGRLKKKLVGSIPYDKNIYLTDYLETPFVMGVLHPNIYVPSTLTKQELPYILAHEEHHMKRRDYIIKPIAFFALCLHWFNPLVWLSFFLFCEDMEMSCDEAVIRKLGENVRADYAASLLSVATGHHRIGGTPLAFGEGDTKGRIRNMKNWKKPVLWIVVLAVISCMLLGVFLLTNREEENDKITTAAQAMEALDAHLIAANYMQQGRKTADGQHLVWDEESFAETDIQGQTCYAMRLHVSEDTAGEMAGELYGTFAISQEGGTVYQANPVGEPAEQQWQELSVHKPNPEPVPGAVVLTEETAHECMQHILQSFVLQEDGTVTFTIPDQIPQSTEKKIELNITLFAGYRVEGNSHTTQDLLENETSWQGGETYTGKLDLQLGELQRVFLRVAFRENLADGGWNEVYPVQYIELTPPFVYGKPLEVTENKISASQNGENVTVDMTFTNAPAAQLTFTLPQGISLSHSDDADPFAYQLRSKDEQEIGEMFFMELAADAEDLKNVETAKNELPMQVYAGVALSNHMMYDHYTVHKHEKTSAAATALVSSQDLNLLGEEYSAAAEIPFANEKNVVLFYDYEKMPVFMQISFEHEAVSQEACAAIAKSIAVN